MEDPIRRLPSNALYNTAAAFVPVFLALVTTPFVLSRLGNEAFGLYLVSLSVASFAGLLDLGLGTASIKFVSEYRARGDVRALSDLVNTLLLARLPQTLAIAALGYFGAPWVCRRVLMVPLAHLEEAGFVVRVSVLTLSISILSGSLIALPRALHRYDIAARIGMLHGVLLTGGTVVVLALGYGLRAIVLAELGLGILSLLIAAIVARRLLPEWQPAWRFAAQSLGRLVEFGGLTMLNSFAGFVFLHVNRILISRSLGLVAIPFYAIPWSLTSRVTQLSTALTEAVAPAASAMAAGSLADRLNTLYERALALTAITATTFLIPLGVGAFDLLGLWLGPEFAVRGGLILRTLALSAFAQALSAVPYFVLTGLGRPGAANLPPLLAALVDVVLAIVLLPRLGLPGLALAMLVGTTLQTALLVRSVDTALGVGTSAARTLAKPVAGAVIGVTAGVLLGSQLHAPVLRLVVGCATALLLQHTVLVLFGCYGSREVRMIQDAIRRGGSSSARSVGGNA
jgi:O-antigen/teichoic acid export membrane protein